MEYTCFKDNGQLVIENRVSILQFPSCLYGFMNTQTLETMAQSGRRVIRFKGELMKDIEDRSCPHCGRRMHINNQKATVLRHLCIGSSLTCVEFPRYQYKCPHCGKTKMQHISFKAERHRITQELYQYTEDLLSAGTYTNKQVAEITGLGKNTVKDIDMRRLKGLYIRDGKL